MSHEQRLGVGVSCEISVAVPADEVGHFVVVRRVELGHVANPPDNALYIFLRKAIDKGVVVRTHILVVCI
jgi:hypothetical protein